MTHAIRWLNAVLLTVALLTPTAVLAQARQNQAQQNFQAQQTYQEYRLNHVRAADIVRQVRSVLANDGPTPQVLVSPLENRLVIKGTQQQQQTAIQLLRNLDRPQKNPARERRQQLPNRVESYRVPAEELKTITTELKRRFPVESGVRIAANERLSEIIAIAPAGTQEQIVAFLRNRNAPATTKRAPMPTNLELNGQRRTAIVRRPTVAPAPRPGQSPQGYDLNSINWQAFENYLVNLFGRRIGLTTAGNGDLSNVTMPEVAGNQPVMQIDRRNNRLHFTGPDNVSAGWLQVAQALDSPPGSPTRQTDVLPVRRASPNTVHKTIALLKRTPKHALASRTTLALTLNAGRPWAGHLMNDIFTQGAGQDTKKGDTTKKDATKKQGDTTKKQGDGAPPIGDDDAGLIGDVQIEYIEGLGIFVIRGNKRDVEKVRRIINEIERQTKENEPEIIVHNLKNVNGRALSELILQLYDQVFAQRQSPVSITPLDQPNALLLIGQKESIDSVIALIEKLDQPLSPEASLRIFPLKHASAVEVERQVRAWYVDIPGSSQDPRPPLGTRPRILADFRTNSVIVMASPRGMIEIEHLIKNLDKGDAEADSMLRVFPLRNTLATELAQVLSASVTSTPPAQGAGGAPGGGQGGGAAAATTTTFTQKAANLTLFSVDTTTNKMFKSGILADAVFTADTNSNAIIVRAPSESMELIGELIRQLDNLPDAKAEIKVYTIENGDATSLAQMLQALFGQQVTAGQGAIGNAFGQALTQSAAAGTGESSLVPLRIAVDVRTNSIIVSGGLSDLEVVEALLARLDEGDIETRKLEVFRLKNAFSDDVAFAITNFLQSQRTLIQQQLQFSQAVSPFEQIEREVIVVSEPVSNSLIVSATPRYFDQIVKVIHDLDYRPPMVMVQVLIAEVRLSDQFEYGTEVGVQDSLLFDRGAASIGFPFANATGLGNDLNATSQSTRNTLAGQGLTGFALGRSSDLGYGGLTLSAANESINILFRALQDAGRLQILSRPQIMTLDNQQAFVQVGSRVPRVTETNLVQGVVQNGTTDVDVGLLLNVRPRISPDGLVVMEVGAEKSEVNFANAIQIGPGTSQPQIDTTTAQTVVSARSGQTIVFAGLITKSKTVNKRGIPYLSQVPLLGNLFKFEQEIEERNELMIIMTPYIVSGEKEGDWLKWIETERMSWCLADIVDIHGDVGVSGGHGLWGTQSPTIFPDMDPTGDRAENVRSDNVPQRQSARPRRTIRPRRRATEQRQPPVHIESAPTFDPRDLPPHAASAYRRPRQQPVQAYRQQQQPMPAYQQQRQQPAHLAARNPGTAIPRPPMPTQLPTRITYGPSDRDRNIQQYAPPNGYQGDLLSQPMLRYEQNPNGQRPAQPQYQPPQGGVYYKR